MFQKPAVDLNDPAQNEFVQDYLQAFMAEHVTAQEDDYGKLNAVIEIVQETYTGSI